MIFGILVSAALGALFASFAGVVAARLHTGQSWLRERSRCDSCRATLSPLALIPIVSWLSTRGHCRVCGTRVSFFYTLVEILLAAVFALAYAKLGMVSALPVFMAALVVLTVIVLYDMRHTVVPLVPALLLIALSALFAGLTLPNIATLGSVLMVAGGIGFGFFALFAVSRGRWRGLGDAPVALALALLVGTRAPAGLLFSFWIGGLIGAGILVLRARGSTLGSEVPFVPFLAAGFLLAYFTVWNPLALSFF